MNQFNVGDVVYHKATHKRCVIAKTWSDGEWRVTTEDGESKVYSAAELWSEQEWEMRNKNEIEQ